jgi:inorganic pyrophosphatase
VNDENFWAVLDALVDAAEVVVEWTAGSPHPRFPESAYPLDYGFLRGTRSGDAADIDVFLGRAGARTVTGIVSTVDGHKRDAEVKVLLDCTPAQADAVLNFLSWPGSFGCLLQLRPATA